MLLVNSFKLSLLEMMTKYSSTSLLQGNHPGTAATNNLTVFLPQSTMAHMHTEQPLASTSSTRGAQHTQAHSDD
jgi:hypothetical protein